MQDSSLLNESQKGGITFVSICVAVIVLLILAYIIIKEWLKRLK